MNIDIIVEVPEIGKYNLVFVDTADNLPLDRA